MKMFLILIVFMVAGLTLNADDSTTAQTTQADWFSPSCPTCSKLLTPGSANLGNSKGVFRPNDKKSKKKKPSVTSDPVSK